MSLLTSLISYWNLDETSGNRVDSNSSNDLTESAAVSSVAGKINNAATFDGSNYLYHADNASLSTGDIDWTISCWAKTDSSFSTAKSIMQKAGANDLEYDLGIAAGASPSFRIRVSSGAGFANLTTLITTLAAGANTWYHLVAWHDSVANQIGIALNAGTPDTASYSNGTYDSGAQFTIGGYPAFGENWTSAIDEVGFWKRVLTSQERADLYNGGAGLAYSAFGGAGPVATGVFSRFKGVQPLRVGKTFMRVVRAR